jgi:hypothetical protein
MPYRANLRGSVVELKNSSSGVQRYEEDRPFHRAGGSRRHLSSPFDEPAELNPANAWHVMPG